MSITISGTTGVSGVNGTASTPAVQGGDTDTGLYFPTANQVAVALGGVQKAIMNADETTFKTRFVVDCATGSQLSLVGNNYANGYAALSMSADGVFDITPLNSSFGYGSLNLSGSLKVNSSVGTSGQVLTSGGSGAAPSWASRGFASTTITNTSRASGTTFQNTTNGTMLVTVVGANNGASMSAGATAGSLFQVSRQNATYTAVSCMVPPGWYYSATYSVLNSWIEGQ